MRARPLCALVVASIVAAGSFVGTARATEPRTQTDRLCLSVAQANAIVEALPHATVAKMASGHEAFTMHLNDDGMVLETESSSAFSVPVTAARFETMCSAVSDSATLKNSVAIRAAYLLAYQYALAFRSTHAWPGDRANLSAPHATVILATYGRYYLVMFADWMLRRNSAGDIVLGCNGEEDYWVDLADDDVRAFSGCVESGGVPGLPRLPQLPP